MTTEWKLYGTRWWCIPCLSERDQLRSGTKYWIPALFWCVFHHHHRSHQLPSATVSVPLFSQPSNWTISTERRSHSNKGLCQIVTLLVATIERCSTTFNSSNIHICPVHSHWHHTWSAIQQLHNVPCALHCAMVFLSVQLFSYDKQLSRRIIAKKFKMKKTEWVHANVSIPSFWSTTASIHKVM